MYNANVKINEINCLLFADDKLNPEKCNIIHYKTKLVTFSDYKFSMGHQALYQNNKTISRSNNK